MPGGIRTRLTLSHLAVIVVAMGLSGLLLLSLLERYFVQAMEDSLLAQARITAQTLSTGAMSEASGSSLPSSAFNALQQRSTNLSLQAENVGAPAGGDRQAGIDLSYLSRSSLQLNSQLDTRIRILDSTGAVIVDSTQESQGVSLASDPLAMAALAGKHTSRIEGSGRDAIMSLALPWYAGGRLVGVIYLSQPMRDVAAVLHDLRIRLLLATLLAVILAAGVGLLLSGAIARPLRRLTLAAGAIADGHLGLQVPVRSRDELGRLSSAFNEMTGRLRASRQAQLDLVANVSHELRTPLTTVKGMVETLRDGAVDEPEVRDRFLESVEGETDRMIRLVNGLLLLSSADSGALQLKRASLDLAYLVERTMDRLEPLAQKKGVQLSFVSNGSARAYVDADRIEQVLVNLLDNAIKYSAPGDAVRVRVGLAASGMVEVEVQDEGVGIPPEALTHIGERFFRADKARSRAEGGSGLGLAIARALVEAHGGQLSLASEEDKGTTVTLHLPSLASPP